MRILLLGASGFIGSELAAFLESRGHDVVPAVRDIGSLARREGAPPPIRVDLHRDTAPEAWTARLARIDAVVNCAGVLQGGRAQSIDAIHGAGPGALFEACERVGVRRVVLISAISATLEANTAYALTKLRAEEDLRRRNLEWVVLRPSLVVARGAFGGTALFRALAALPWFLPVPGRGEQAFQPIWIEDLALTVARALESDALVRRTLEPVGPDALPLRRILSDLRRWLGLKPVPVVPVPMAIVRVAAWWGERLGGPLGTTALAQMEHGNTGSVVAFRDASGVDPRPWASALAAHPAQWQDRWHARLYFVRPLLRLALAALWIGSAIAGFAGREAWTSAVAQALGISVPAAGTLLSAACALDLAIGALVLARWKPGMLAVVQIAAILAYTVGVSMVHPHAWVDPLGALLKNLPILAAVLALAAIENDR